MPEDHNDPKPSWGPGAAILVSIGAFFGAQFLAGVILAFWPSLLGFDAASTDKWFQDGGVVPQFVTVFVFEAFVLLLLALFLKNRGAKGRELGLVKPVFRDIFRTLAGYVIYFCIFYILSTALEYAVPRVNLEQSQEIGYSTTTSGRALVLVFISLVILPPFVEEVLFRGFLFGGLRKKWAFLPSALLTSLLFAVAHLWGGESDAMIWVAAIDTFVLSMILVYLREKYKTLWPSIFVHMLKNTMAFLVLFIFKDVLTK